MGCAPGIWVSPSPDAMEFAVFRNTESDRAGLAFLLGTSEPKHLDKKHWVTVRSHNNNTKTGKSNFLGGDGCHSWK